ncbi:MAG TPA: tripartite tricarboxylate transporter TctB family protein [Paracoccaceae bacterium]|nr:tripartite tricarboxylate transporter TctB family protein [Paracoccaceae bacterium]
MTVRTAELLMAVILAIASAGIMLSAAKLNIGWVPGRGPGAGAWPFWLAGGMLLAQIATIIRWFLRQTPESRSLELFVSPGALVAVGTAVVLLTLLLLGTHYVGIYISLILFLFISIRLVGRNGWFVSIATSILFPVGLFLFFEWALKVPLPKGISEPLFYPIYRIIY